MADSFDLGAATAYALAVEHGYEGTIEQFAAELTGATDAARAAAQDASDAEAYAIGKRGGVDVGSTDPAYHNNAKYYKDFLTVDDTLSIPGRAADAKMTGDEISGLRGEINNALEPSFEFANLCQGIQKGKQWVAWNPGDTVTLTDNANYMAATVNVSGISAITLNRDWDNNSYCFYTDSNNNRIGLLRDYQINGVNYAYTVPDGAVYAYISQNITSEELSQYIDTEGVVVLAGETSIYGRATIEEYPYGGELYKIYHADELRMNGIGGKKLSNILSPLNGLPDVVIKSTKTIYNKTGLPNFNDAPNNSLITVLIPVSTPAADLPENYPVNNVIKGVGQLITYLSSDGSIKIQTYRNAVQGITYTRQYTVGTGWQAWNQPDVVRTDSVQEFSAAQKSQARNNIGAVELAADLTEPGKAAEAKTVGDEISGLKDELNTALTPSLGVANLCQGIEKGKYWVAWNDGDTVTPNDNSNYMAATVIISGASAITLNRSWDNNSYCFYADSDNKRIGMLRDYQISGVDYAYTVPDGAVYAYISQNITAGEASQYIDTEGVVVLAGSTSIYGIATIEDYPYGGEPNKVYHADELYMDSIGGKKLSNILLPLNGLPDVVIKSTKTIYNKAGLSDFNDAPVNSLITVLIAASTNPSDLPANYPTGRVIKGVGQLITYLSSDGNIKIQTYRNAVQGITYSRQYTVGNGWQPWNYPNIKNRFTCLKNGSGDFSSLVAAVNTLCERFDAELFVGPGTWDIIDELGADYMNAVSSSSATWGLVLKNRIHIICSSNSIITAKYTGDNTNVKTYFSVFNAGENGFTIENAHIESDNIRYTIHDDRGANGGEGYYNRYIKCFMKHTNGMYSDCIGGGLGTNGLIEIKDCYFEGDSNATRLVYYHGNNYRGQTDAKCKIIVSGNYFAGLGTFGLTKYGDSTKVSKAYVSNNSVGSQLFVNSGSYAPQDNMEMIEWNNVVRTNG